MYQTLKSIFDSLMNGKLVDLNPRNIQLVSDEAVRIINKPELNDYDQMNASLIISISQIVYNNTDRSILFLDDGVYDILLEKYKRYNENFQVGAPVIKFNQDGEAIKEELINPVTFLENSSDFIDNSLYYNDLTRMPPVDPNLYRDIDRNSGRVISKKNVNVPHMYPKLVGSLDKCKFTLDREAMERDVFNDENVKIFERDFLAKHLQMGLIDKETPFELIAELKYDGISVEADVTDRILSARSRGDANNDIAADLTPILGGYRFPFAPIIPPNEAFGIKFEAIMTYMNLSRMSELKGKSYKNSRNGIIGLCGSSDAYDYRDLITLVPLATSMEGIDRVTEIEFLNKYYNSGEYLRYAVLKGTYNEILYQVYKFVKEAEAMRPMLPFMYDGVVISYRDPKIIKALGRENSINKYSVAIKFSPLVREAIFTGYSYTVGQDGRITPMIHYTPVEFNGTVHTKSSGHSYGRFKELNLAIGDIVHVEYTNDVMPYVTKPNIQNNMFNQNYPEPFPSHCPCCGHPLAMNNSMKSVYCPNMNCPERVIARIANMMAKLNIKDFGEETFRTLGTKSLAELLNYTYDDVYYIGETNAKKLLSRIEELKTTPIYDYKILGSIGFTGVSFETWKKILSKITLQEIATIPDNHLAHRMSNIKGIGPKIINIVLNERRLLYHDLQAVLTLNVCTSRDCEHTLKIRFTGCRPDSETERYLEFKGYDARGDASVTKDTDILVVPYIGFSSSKVKKAGRNTRIMDMASFMANINMLSK